jgi:hypothetical protein
MKQNRLIFYTVFGVLHLFIFLFSFYLEYIGKHDTGKLFSLYQNFWALKYCSLILVILFITNIILHIRDNRRNLREKDELNKELDTLKARLFDLQETSKRAPEQNPDTN